MSKLTRWLPFKFRRDQSRPQRAESGAQAEQSGPAAMARTGSGLYASPLSQPLQSFFDDPFFRDPFAHLNDLSRWFGNFSPTHFDPRIDVIDEEDGLRVTAELPGLDENDVKVELEGDHLIIRGEKRNENESTEDGVYRTERYFGSFRRVLPLPSDVDIDKADASFTKGVLNVRFPKTTGDRTGVRQIPVRS